MIIKLNSSCSSPIAMWNHLLEIPHKLAIQIQKYAACIVTSLGNSEHITYMLHDFHWLDVPKIRTKKYRARRPSYASSTLWNAISDDGFKNSKHVDDFRKGLKTQFSLLVL